VQRLAMATGRPLKLVAPDVIARTTAQMRTADAGSARMHLASVRRILDREEPDYRT